MEDSVSRVVPGMGTEGARRALAWEPALGLCWAGQGASGSGSQTLGWSAPPKAKRRWPGKEEKQLEVMEGNHHAHVTRVAPGSSVDTCAQGLMSRGSSGEPAGVQGPEAPSSFYATASSPGSWVPERRKGGRWRPGKAAATSTLAAQDTCSALSKSSSQVSVTTAASRPAPMTLVSRTGRVPDGNCSWGSASLPTSPGR